MPTYRFCGETPRAFPTLGRVLAPGDEIESDQELRHPSLQLVTKARKSAAPDESPTPPEN